jgi:hypothetical protein
MFDALNDDDEHRFYSQTTPKIGSLEESARHGFLNALNFKIEWWALLGLNQ